MPEPHESCDDDYRAQLAGKVILAMERNSDSMEFVMSRQHPGGDSDCASPSLEEEDRGDGEGPGVECGCDEIAQAHELHRREQANCSPVDAGCEMMDDPEPAVSAGEARRSGTSTQISAGVAEAQPLRGCGQEIIRQVSDETMESADSSSLVPARLASACSAASCGRTASASSAESGAPLLQVGSVVVTKSQRVREVPVMGSECMRDGHGSAADQESKWMRQGVRGKSFHSMLHSAPVPRLNLKQPAHDLGSQNVNRVITFHDLFATLNVNAGASPSDFGSPQSSRPSTGRPATRGLISRGIALSRTPTVRTRLITTPRAQTARDSNNKNHDDWMYRDVVKPMTAGASKPLQGWWASDVVELDGGHCMPQSEQQDIGSRVDRMLRTPTYIGMGLRGSITARDSVRSQRPYTVATPRDGSARSIARSSIPLGDPNRLQRLSQEKLLLLFRESQCDVQGDGKRGSKAPRYSFLDAAPVGHGSSGLFSVITPRRQETVAPRTSPTSGMDRNTPHHEVVDGLRSMLLQRKLVCAPAISTRARTSYYDDLRRHTHKLQWCRYERECRDLWSVMTCLPAIDRNVSFYFVPCLSVVDADQGTQDASACHRRDCGFQPKSTAETSYDSEVL